MCVFVCFCECASVCVYVYVVCKHICFSMHVDVREQLVRVCSLLLSCVPWY